ncbi:transketolase, partial [Francisella tularensis subsp. holarctica]|nr:transketolase [Francisella tularensis subsp. holarctica]
AKELNWDYQAFEIPQDVYKDGDAREKGQSLEANWQGQWNLFKDSPKFDEFERVLSKELPVGLESAINDYISSQLSNPVKVATRKASQMELEVLCKNMPEMFG